MITENFNAAAKYSRILFPSGKLKNNVLEVMMMKKMLRENKGFSLVELLVAILIMAVIAGTAITLFGGVLNSSRENADTETAESIKRAILTYMNSTNDVNLSCLGVDDGVTESIELIQYLGLQINIPPTGAPTFKRPGSVDDSKVTAIPSPSAADNEASDIKGDFGPFLDLTKDFNPKKPGTVGWIITIDEEMQVVHVESHEGDDDDCVVNFESGVSVSS